MKPELYATVKVKTDYGLLNILQGLYTIFFINQAIKSAVEVTVNF